MEDLIVLAIGLGSFAFLLMLGLLAGGWIERSHLGTLSAREANTADMLVTQTKSFFGGRAGPTPPVMIVAEVVLSADYLKTFLGGLKKLIGGEIGSYSTLLARARREALLRILEEARQMGYNAVCNVRLETADVGGTTGGQKAVMVAILASATAYHAQRAVDAPSQAAAEP